MELRKMNKWILFFVLAAFISVGCETDDDSAGDNSGDNTEEIETANALASASGTWRVANYTDDGENETSDYNGYAFTFFSNGDLTAVNDNNTISGTWSITNDSSSDDSSSESDIDFTIFFNVSDDSDFEDLNDDWDLVSITASTITLIDISGGDGSIDRLTFEKN